VLVAGARGYTPAGAAADLHHLVRSLGAGPVAVVGHDLGGIAAVAWARDHPGDVRRLVVSGAGVPGAGLEERAPPHVARFAADPDAVAARAAGRERDWLAAFTGSPAFASSGALDDAVAAYARPGRMRLALRQYAGLADDAAANRAARLAVPVTALEGGAPGIASATLPRVARDVRTVMVPGTGHYLLVERPGAVADAIAAAAR
jgi:pimeloyl-ACP methyl ester carboxylesterase